MSEAFLGVQYGLLLSILVGPLLLLLVQSCIERGVLAGLIAGSGIWTSDLLFVVGVQLSYAHFEVVTKHPLFSMVLGGVGGLFLIGVGVHLIRTRKTPLRQLSSRSLASDWSKGFLVNTLNPFTVFFWLLMSSSVVADNAYSSQQSWDFFLGLLGTIVATDVLKVLLAKRVRRLLIGPSLSKIRMVNGLLFIGFGMVLAGRSIVTTFA